MDYLSICAVAKGEAPYIEEWLTFHIAAGVERFYIVIHDDDPAPMRQAMAPFMDAGYVVSFHFPIGRITALQPFIYLCLRAQINSRWVAFIDIDEFLFPPQGSKDLKDILSSKEDLEALAVNWACFGSSGFIARPTSQIGSYRFRAADNHPANRTFKTIADPRKIQQFLSPHAVRLWGGSCTYDDFYQPVLGVVQNENERFFGENIRINHYRVRSRREFWEKMTKWQGKGHPDLVAGEDSFWSTFDFWDVEDHQIMRYL